MGHRSLLLLFPGHSFLHPGAAHLPSTSTDFGVEFGSALLFYSFPALFSDVSIELRSIFALNRFAALSSGLFSQLWIRGEPSLEVVFVRATMGFGDFLSACRSASRSRFLFGHEVTPSQEMSCSSMPG